MSAASGTSPCITLRGELLPPENSPQTSRRNLARDSHRALDDLLHRHIHELLDLVRNLHRHVHVLVDDLRDVDRPLHRLDLRHLDRALHDMLHRDIHDLRHRDLADLLHCLDLDLRHVHVASVRDILNLHARHVANDFLDVRDFHRNILDLNLGNLCFFFSYR